MTKHTDTPDPLTDMFEDMGIKVVDVTPKDQSVTETPNTLPTDTDDQSEIWSVIDRYVDAGHISDDGITAIQDAIALYTTNREREARINEQKYIAWSPSEVKFIERQADRISELQNQASKENTNDQL